MVDRVVTGLGLSSSNYCADIYSGGPYTGTVFYDGQRKGLTRTITVIIEW